MTFSEKLVKCSTACFAENGYAELFRNALHFSGNGSIVFVEVSVVATCVYNVEIITVLVEVKVDFLDYGVFGVFEVDVDKSADSAGHLVHKTALFAEVNVFCKLCDFCDFNVVDVTVVVEVVEDVTDHYLKSGGGRKS